MSTNLRYRVQSNAFVVDKANEIEKPKFYNNLCRASTRNTRQRYICVVRFIWGAWQRLTTVSVCPSRPACHGRRSAWASLLCALARRTAKIYLCRAPLKRHTAKMSAPCVYRNRAACRRRTAKSGLCHAPDRKRPANHLTHGKGRLSGSVLHAIYVLQSWVVIYMPCLFRKLCTYFHTIMVLLDCTDSVLENFGSVPSECIIINGMNMIILEH
jgi:hypothetical protein